MESSQQKRAPQQDQKHGGHRSARTDNCDGSTGQKSSPKNSAGELTMLEIWLSSLITIVYTLVLLVNVYHTSRAIEDDERFDSQLTAGWSFLHRKKDVSDNEWLIWAYMARDLFAASIIHVVTSCLAHTFMYQYRRHVWLAVSLACMAYIVDPRVVLFLVLKCSTFFFVTYLRSVLICWVLAVAWLFALNYQDSEWLLYMMHDPRQVKFGLVFFSIAFLLLRCISFSVERVRYLNETKLSHKKLTFSFFDFLVSAFYLPYYYSGPTVIYPVFQAAVLREKRRRGPGELRAITLRVGRGILCILAIELSTHFLYIHAIAANPPILHTAPLCTLGAVVYFFCELFYMKYLVVYGLAASVMELDHLDPPANPRCIVHLVHFSEYWRYFDPGLHNFLKTYLYIPLGGSWHGFPRQLFATMVTFLFVYYWHGATNNLFIWAFYNFVGITIETISARVSKMPAFMAFETRYLSAAMIHRLHAVFNLPLYIFSIFAIFIFFTDYDSAWIIFSRFILEGTWTSWILTILPLYIFIILSREIKQWEDRRHEQIKQK